MDKRTTIIVNRNIIDYLHEQNINVSRLCDKALTDRAIDLGYLDVANEIRRLSLRLNRLKAIDKKKGNIELRQYRFAMALKGYLSTGSKSPDKIKAWLISPANREFSQIIGRSDDLTEIRINELVTLAHTTPDLLEG